MALQLHQIPGNLQSMSRELSGDADIKSDVNKLVIRGTKCVQSFDRMMRYEYREVFIQKELLFKANDAGEVNVSKLTNSVSEMSTKIKAIRDDIMSTQSEVHSDIEKCRSRVKEKQNNLRRFDNNVSRMQREIRDLESDISRLEGEIPELDKAARNLESRARDIDREAEEKTGWGIGGIFMAIAGVILAPVSFGLSLSLTATGGILAGVNLSNAAECRDGARRARNSADEKRNESSMLSLRKMGKQNEIEENKRNIRSTKKDIETIESDERTLQSMIDQMHKFVTVIDNVLNVFQEAETTLKDVQVNSASFSVMKNAFMRNPTKAAQLSQRHLGNLKAKWEEMETILSRHGLFVKASNSLEQHKMVQTIAAIELYHAQREVANDLELAYLNLADHPDVAREVRMTAHAARSQHLLTSGLMKKFTVTAVHIIKTMIPMILDAVELQDRDIIIEAFGQIIQNAESMKKESEDTRSSYLTLQTKYKELMKGYQSAEENVHRAQKERRGVVERMTEQRKEAHERLAKRKELSMQSAGLGNVESLREALLHLGDVDRQFTRIIQFWENMAATLKYLKEDVRSGEVYLKKIEDERYAQRFKKSISRAEKDWQFFGKICSDYVQESDTEIMQLYNFLSSPYRSHVQFRQNSEAEGSDILH